MSHVGVPERTAALVVIDVLRVVVSVGLYGGRLRFLLHRLLVRVNRVVYSVVQGYSVPEFTDLGLFGVIRVVRGTDVIVSVRILVLCVGTCGDIKARAVYLMPIEEKMLESFIMTRNCI